MANPNLVPVDHDPFSGGQGETTPAGVKLVPVDHDPFTGQKPLAWSDVPGQALRNTPASAGHFVSNLAHMVAHPIDTMTGLADLGAGAIREGAKRVLPAGVVSAIDYLDAPETTKRIENAATGTGQFLKDRYGGFDQIKHTLATDPVGAAADAAAILSGGGGLAPRAPGVVGRVGQAVSAIGSAIDPVVNTGRVLSRSGQVAADLIGTTTGAGSRPFREAYNAGATGNTTLLDHMRGNAPLTDAVDMAESAVRQMGRERSASYDANMASVRASQQPMNFDPVLQALDQARDLAIYRSPSGRAIVRDQAALDTHTRIANLVNEFMSLPAVERTPSAFDALKQSIGDIRQRTQQGTSERSIADQIYRTVRNEISTQVPSYAAAMREYGQASEAINEMRRTLSVNDRASMDTTARKLLSSMRNNVNANFGQRERLVDELAMHEPNLPAALAGQTLATLAPRGLARLGITEGLQLGAAYLNPSTLAALPLQSPRLMGEAAYAAGRVGRAVERALTRAGVTPQRTISSVRGGRIAGGLAAAIDEEEEKRRRGMASHPDVERKRAVSGMTRPPQ